MHYISFSQYIFEVGGRNETGKFGNLIEVHFILFCDFFKKCYYYYYYFLSN